MSNARCTRRNRDGCRSSSFLQSTRWSVSPTPGVLRAGRRRLGDLGEELVVALRRADLVDQQLEALAVLERVQHPAQLPDLLELVPVEQQLLVPRARRLDVDRRVDPPLGES